jgi:hypothetical protein
MAQALTIQIMRGDQLISTQTFERDLIKIGRLASAHLKLEDLKVARIHAVIELTNGGRDVSIIDMGSAEGTFLNGEKTQKGKLKDGDTVVVGETKLVIRFGIVAAATATPAAAIPAAPVPGAAAAARPVVGVPQQQRPMTQAPAPAIAAQAQHAAPVQQGGAGGPMMQGNAALQASPYTPSFDRGAVEFEQPLERISHGHLGRAALGEGGELEPEQPLSMENRSLELRLYWGDIVLDIRHLVKPKQITIGETKNTDVFISSEGLPKEEFPLIRFHEDEYILTFFDTLEGEIDINGEMHALRDLKSAPKVTRDDNLEGCYRLPMGLNTRAIVHWGGLTLAMRFVSAPRRITGAPVDFDWQFLNIFLLSMFLMAMAIITFSLYPTDTEKLDDELLKSDNRFAQFLLEKPKPPEQQKAAEDFLKRIEEKDNSPSKAKADEGKFGKDKAPPKDAKSAVKAIKPDDKEVIKNAGILKFLGGGGGFSQVMGNTPGLGGDVQNAIGNLQGKSVGDSGGLGGLGLRGAGPGGGGIGDSIGLAKGVGTEGRMGGKGNYGSGGGNIGGKRETDISIADAPPVVQGAIDPALIRKVIQDNKNAIKYCYEKELQVKKDLGGTIKLQFIIGGEGRVTMAVVKETTMGNPNVENCIAGKIRGLEFPKPKGGGIVLVNYPFTFKSAN